MINVYAVLLNENKKPSKLLIPPSSTRACKVTRPIPEHIALQAMSYEFYISSTLAKRSLLLIQTVPGIYSIYQEELLIYNGGWESQWIEHGDHIISIYEFRT